MTDGRIHLVGGKLLLVDGKRALADDCCCGTCNDCDPPLDDTYTVTLSAPVTLTWQGKSYEFVGPFTVTNTDRVGWDGCYWAVQVADLGDGYYADVEMMYDDENLLGEGRWRVTLAIRYGDPGTSWGWLAFHDDAVEDLCDPQKAYDAGTWTTASGLTHNATTQYPTVS